MDLACQAVLSIDLFFLPNILGTWFFLAKSYILHIPLTAHCGAGHGKENRIESFLGIQGKGKKRGVNRRTDGNK